MSLEDFQNVIFIILSIIGVGCLALGIFLMNFPPKRINGLYGYRTSRSMQNHEAWHYSQRYSAKIMVVLGLVYLVLGIVSLFIPKMDDMISAITSIAVVLAGVFIMFFKTERELAKKFDF